MWPTCGFEPCHSSYGVILSSRELWGDRLRRYAEVLQASAQKFSFTPADHNIVDAWLTIVRMTRSTYEFMLGAYG